MKIKIQKPIKSGTPVIFEFTNGTKKEMVMTKEQIRETIDTAIGAEIFNPAGVRIDLIASGYDVVIRR